MTRVTNLNVQLGNRERIHYQADHPTAVSYHENTKELAYASHTDFKIRIDNTQSKTNKNTFIGSPCPVYCVDVCTQLQSPFADLFISSMKTTPCQDVCVRMSCACGTEARTNKSACCSDITRTWSRPSFHRTKNPSFLRPSAC